MDLRRCCWMVGFCGVCLASWAAGQEAEEEGEPFREAYYASEVEEANGTPQAVRVGGVVFVAGISSPGEDLETQLRGAYMRVQAILGQYGMTMENVAQERVYTTDMEALNRASEARVLSYGSGVMPASTWVEVARLKETGRLVEIEVIAVEDPPEE